jgi:RNA polymerase sigma-70 factor (ECF subfamily)
VYINLLNPIITKGISDEILDEELVRLYLETMDTHYFNMLYDRYVLKVMAKCTTLLKESSLAEDATQDIFMKVLLKLSSFSGRSKFSTWLYSMTYNFCIDEIRRKKKDISVYVDDFFQFEDTEEEVDDQEIMETNVKRLKIVLDEIPVDDKTILLMKYQDAFSILDISKAMDKSESAIKMKIKRAKEKFIKIYNHKYKSA